MALSTEGCLRIIYLMSFLDMFAVSLMIPFLAPYLKSLGASHLIIGLSSSLYAAAQLISGPLVGCWSDRHGRTQVLSFSLAVCSGVYLVLGLTTSLPFILLLRVLLGCMKHTQSLCRAMVADIAPQPVQIGAYGALAAASGMGFVVGPALGGHLAEYSRGLAYICTIIATCFWCNIGLAVGVLNSVHTKKPANITKGTIGSELFQVFRHLQMVKWSVHKKTLGLKLIFVYTLALFHNNYSLSLREQYSLSAKIVGYVISFQSFIGSFLGLVSHHIRKLYEKIYSRTVAIQKQVTHSFFLMAIALTGLVFAYNVPLLLFWLIPLAASQSFLRNLLTELLVQKAGPEERGSLLGTAHSLSAMARLCAPIIAGVGADLSSHTVPALTQTGAILGMVMSAIWFS